MRNVEIKAKVRQLAALIEKAKELSGSEATILKQHDTFYKINNGRLKLRKFEEGNAELIFYDRPDQAGPKLSSFEKSNFNDGKEIDGLHNVLTKAFGISGVVKKTRQLFLVGQTRIHIDSVEDLGDFMELEVCLKPDQTAEEGQKIAKDLMVKLGINEDDLLTSAYTDILNKK